MNPGVLLEVVLISQLVANLLSVYLSLLVSFNLQQVFTLGGIVCLCLASLSVFGRQLLLKNTFVECCISRSIRLMHTHGGRLKIFWT